MMIQENDREMLRKLFAERLVSPVRLAVFTQESSLTLPVHLTCQWCRDTVRLMEELSETSEKINVTVYDFARDKEAVSLYKVDKIPAIVVGTNGPGRVVFYGIPAGYEFAALIESIIDVSVGTTSLSPRTKEKLSTLGTDVHIQVFATPTCPFCPRAIRLAHQMAVESPRVRADAVEISEFPHLAQKYGVMGVPKVVINERTTIEGEVPESVFLLHVREASGDLTPEEAAQMEGRSS